EAAPCRGNPIAEACQIRVGADAIVLFAAERVEGDEGTPCGRTIRTNRCGDDGGGVGTSRPLEGEVVIPGGQGASRQAVEVESDAGEPWRRLVHGCAGVREHCRQWGPVCLAVL